MTDFDISDINAALLTRFKAEMFLVGEELQSDIDRWRREKLAKIDADSSSSANKRG